MEKGLAEGFVCLFLKNHLREEKKSDEDYPKGELGLVWERNFSELSKYQIGSSSRGNYILVIKGIET